MTKSFQRHMNVKMMRTAMIGLESGRTILRKIVNYWRIEARGFEQLVRIEP